MRTGGGADDVEGVVDVRDPVAQTFVHRVLERRRARGDGDDLCTQQLHAEHIGLLPRDVGRAHIDHAGQAEARADRRGGDTVLSRAGFRDDPRLAHAHREQDLADTVVDLVRAGMVELVALEPDLRALALGGIFPQFLGQPFGII